MKPGARNEDGVHLETDDPAIKVPCISIEMWPAGKSSGLRVGEPGIAGYSSDTVTTEIYFLWPVAQGNEVVASISFYQNPTLWTATATSQRV